MLTWMLFSTALGAALVGAAMLAEPLARLAHPRTRFLWLFIVVVIIGWSALLAVGAPRAASSDVDARLSSAIGAVATPAEFGNATAPVGVTLSGGILRTLLPRPNIHVDVVLVALWLLGSLACIATLVFSAWRIARMRRSWSPRVIAGIPVLVSHDVGPAVVGLVHHGIVVPAWIESLDEASRRLVMLHEREHVRAGDPLLLWGTTLLVSLMPWNAALWFALRRTRHAIEIDCDARVLRLEADPRAYCSLLIEVGARTLTGVAPAAALAEPTTLLERRVTAMLRSRALGFREVAGGLLAVGLIAVACRTPTPPGFTGIGVTQLARELNARLATESGRAALSSDDRYRLGEALGFITDAPQSATGVPPEMFAEVDSIDTQSRGEMIDAVIGTYYPSLTTGADSTATLVGVVFDTREQVLRHGIRRDGERFGDAATLLRQMELDTVSARTTSLGVARRFKGRVSVVFATEREGPVRGATSLRAVLPPANANAPDMTTLVRGVADNPRSTTLLSIGSASREPAVSALARAEDSQDSARALADSVVRQAVAKHFPGALAGRLGHNPYLWFAADSADMVLRTASGRAGLRTKMGKVNLVTWEGAASMLSGVPASAHPGDELHLKLLPSGRDTIGVVWVRLQAGLPAR